MEEDKFKLIVTIVSKRNSKKRGKLKLCMKNSGEKLS